MADANWHYIENQFDNATRNSKRRAKSIAKKHKDALVNAPATIKAALLGRITPAYAAFEAKYDLWINLRAQRKGAVLVFEQLLDKLSGEDIENIETEFKHFFKRGTPEHAVAFAGGREPYQQGTAEERVEAVDNLQQRIAQLAVANPELTAVVDLVEAVLGPLQAAAAADTGLDSQAELTRTQLEPLRKTLADALYRNMAGLMQELGANEDVAAFFDLELLRETGADEEDPEPIPPPGTPAP